MSQVRTRFAPSPTGFLHVGGARTALFCWLYARRHGGQFVLRIEDTDLERSTDAAKQAILDGLQWLELDCDDGPVYQTERFERYAEVAAQLLDAGHAYRCYCSRERLDALREQQRRDGRATTGYDRHCRELREPPAGIEPVVRFKNPLQGEVAYDDLVMGRLSKSNADLDDMILARADGSPTYNFAVVVDDTDMRISHVVRGVDHKDNTFKQINLLHALGCEVPRYCHVPMIHGADGAKLSKRHGAVSVTQYRDEGFLPEAMRNYLVRLGWSHGDEEIFDTGRLIELFDLAAVNRSAAMFDLDKLRWLNQHYIKLADSARLQDLLASQYAALGVDTAAGPPLGAVVEALRERAPTLREMAESSRYLYQEFDDYEQTAAKKNLTVSAGPVLARLAAELAATDWQPEPLHGAVQRVAEALELKMGKVAQPLRVAISGRAATPPIDVTLTLVGRERTLARLQRAETWVAERAARAGP